MVEISIDKSMMHITGDDFREILAIQGLIGTAKLDSSSPDRPSLRCRTSIQNIRRIKRIVPGAKRSKDAATEKAIARLSAQNSGYLRDNHVLDQARNGAAFGPKDYEFCFTPYEHQLKGFHWMHAAKSSAIFGDCGIGKTAIAASFLDSLKLMGELSPDKPALVVCPISIIFHAWIEDLKKFTNSVKFISIYEPSSYKTAFKRMERLETPADIYIASFSLLRIMEDQLAKKKFQTVIIDESTKIKNPQSKTYRALRKVVEKSSRRYVMSGTPAPNGPLDLWSQFNFVDHGMTLDPSLVDFRHEFFDSIDVNGRAAAFWVSKRGTNQCIHDKSSARAIRFKASECLDLPEQTFSIRELEMGKEQNKAYLNMVDNMFTELETGDTVTVQIPLANLMKLRELTGGFVITDTQEHLPVGTNPKLGELDDLLEQIMGSEENKAIVWIQYQWEAWTLIDRYKKKYGARGLFGGVTQNDKDKAITAFKKGSSCRLLICHPQSAAHGLTLTEAAYSIYYSLSFNFEEYYQSSKRIHRAGQKKPCFYYFLVCKNSVDMALLRCLQGKKNIQDLLIDGKEDPRSLVGIRKK